MNSPSPRTLPVSSPRGGFTILELLLAAALLTAVVAIAAPSFTRAQRAHQVNLASTKLVGRMSAIRVHALTHAVPYEFRYEPDGRRYLIGPASPEAASQGSVRTARTTSQDAVDDPTDSVSTPPTYHGELPEGIRFVPPTGGATADGATVGGASASRLPDNQAAGIPESFRGARWSAPLRFGPDGRAVDARVVLTDADGRRLALEVRGLTGTVRVRHDGGGAR